MSQQNLMMRIIRLIFMLAILGACSPSINPTSLAPVSTMIPMPTDTNITAATSTNTPKPTPWVIPEGAGLNLRAIHMAGNWGTNPKGVLILPIDYFEWLRDLNVNWVGISTAIYVDGSMDSTVEPKYTGTVIHTFTDEELVKLFRAFKQHGFHVYLTLAFEDPTPRSAHPVERWQLGVSNIYEWDSKILPEYWPWALNHPDHDRFVDEFWLTYTDQAVHFAKIAEQEGVEMFSLGTETEGLFRTRPADGRPDDFGDEIRAMVQAVRAVYTGLVTYDYHYDPIIHPEWYSTDTFWDDSGLDVIGISAYFPLADEEPTAVMGVEELEVQWEAIFQKYLIPLHTRNPKIPILFTEFGYVDSLIAPYTPYAQAGAQFDLLDTNGNGLDDGQEVQANIYEAFFNIMERHPGIIRGAFLWDNWMASDIEWSRTAGKQRGGFVRGKPAETVVREQYRLWRDQP
jgi:hypothetical protein